jgi:molecular chaperone DnaJ
VTVRVAPHPDFNRQGDDLVHTLQVSISQATLGVPLTVPTLEDPAELTVPAGTQPGQVFRVKGAGVPSLRGRGRGDLLVRVEVAVPTRLGEEEADLLRQLAELRGEEVAPPAKGAFSRLRSALK